MKALFKQKKIEAELKKFPFIMWDRFTMDGRDPTIYGWIPRKDGRADFVVIWFENGESSSFTTSSAEYSLQIYKTLNESGRGHRKCLRVERQFEIPNAIRLSA